MGSTSLLGIGLAGFLLYFWNKTGKLDDDVKVLRQDVATNQFVIRVAVTNAVQDFQKRAHETAESQIARITAEPRIRIGTSKVTGGKPAEIQVPVADYVVAITGFLVEKADIEEKGTGNLLSLYPVSPKGSKNWQIAANVRTESGKPQESWTVHWMAFPRRLIQ